MSIARAPSLIERAANVYAFAPRRVEPVPGADETASPLPFREGVGGPAPAPGAAFAPTPHLNPLAEGEGLDRYPTLAAVPPEFLAAAGADEDAITPPPARAGEVPIDRGLLAERGMIVPGAPIGPLAEEFRLIKRQLFVGWQRLADASEPDKARTLLICSARPDEGKTFCAINLALSLAAERDTEVLLVDADVAKPDVCKRLGLTGGPGLLDALADGQVDPEALVVRTDVPHLSVLPTGAKTTADTELLASARTRAVLARLLAANPRRLILFDSPPALAASPAAVLAMLVGQVMLVVRADRTPENEVQAAVSQLNGCDQIGLVLNAASFVADRHRFGSYYGQEMPQ